MLFREALVETAVSAITGIVHLSFASEQPVLRDDPKYGGKYWELLSMNPCDCDLSILNREGILCVGHDEGIIIGSVVSARIDPDRKARADVQVYDSATYWREGIAAGRMPGVSCGYVHTGIVSRSMGADGIPVIRVKTQMHEISFLRSPTFAADKHVGINRMKNNALSQMLALLKDEREQSTEDFSDVSIAQVINELGRPATGRVREMHESLRSRGMGRVVHFSALAPVRMSRDTTASNFSSGGAMVGTEMGDPTSLAFNRSVLVASGVEVIDGLTSNFTVPKITAFNPGAQALGEVAKVAASDILTMADALAPMRLSAQVKVSKQLLIQGGQRAENAIRKTITDALSTQLDYLGLLGNGAGDQPLGLVNTPGVQALLFNGAASWPVIVDAETKLAGVNLDFGQTRRVGWATSVSSRARWKQIPKIVGSTNPLFLIGDDGQAGEYPVLASNQLSGNNQAIFAAWDTVKLLLFGEGIEIISDPFTQAQSGEVVFTAIAWFNILPTYPQAVIVSADAANQ